MAIIESKKDHLTSLTPELQHMIFSYLLASHEPDKAFTEVETTAALSTPTTKQPRDHPLDFLAATCKGLRDEVNEWALSFLAKYRNVTKYKPLKNKSRQQQRDFLRSRNGLLNWIEKHCVFCGNKSSRSAILMNGLRCCSKCDREQWPDKITKTEARTRYCLKDEHLLPTSIISPTAAKLLQKHPGLPKVRYGTYISSNVPTTMFLRKDVERLAKLAHGDLKEYLAKKAADRDERRRKAKETKARKDAEAEAEKAKEKRKEHAELMWMYRHKYHSITSYGDEAGPSGPPPLPTTSSPGTKKTKKHKKSLSIDSDAANEGRKVVKPPQQQPEVVRPVSARTAMGVARADPVDCAQWDDLPSMFGMDAAEWDALCPLSPPKMTVETKGKFEVLERWARNGKMQGMKMVEFS